MALTVEQTETPDLGDAFPTVAWLARDWAERTPGAVAMRDKNLGIWQERTWSVLWDEVLTAAHGLLELGVDIGDVVSIHSEDRPEWVILDLAAVAIRAISTGLYPTNPSTEVQYLLNDSGAHVHMAEDQEQVDKVVESGSGSFPNVRTIIYI
jgi:long-chain acyl-CoA synthetase